MCSGSNQFLWCVLSLPVQGPGTCVDLARRPSSLEEPHTGTSALLSMAEGSSLLFSSFPSLSSFSSLWGSWPPSPRRLFAHALLLSLNTRIMCRTDILYCTMIISCFILHFIYWGSGVVGWWTFLDWDNEIVQWWLVLSFFMILAIFISSVMTMSLYLSNSLLHVLFRFH